MSKIKEAQELVKHYDDEYWWFDRDCVIEDALKEAATMQEILDRWQHAAVLTDTPLMQATCEVLGLRDTPYFDRYECGHSFPNGRMESRVFEVPCPDCYLGPNPMLVENKD